MGDANPHRIPGRPPQPNRLSAGRRETEYDAVTGLVTKTVDYSFGLDELTQTTRAYDAAGNVTSEQTLVFGHDGHGNVRVLMDMVGAVSQLFVFDAYGQLLAIMNGAGVLQSGGNGTLADATLAATTLLYSGEQFDPRIGQQYLRARYYDATTGTFNRLDPFFGNQRDPQSFNKYLYTHADPVNGIDPTGRSLIGSLGGFAGSLAVNLGISGAAVTALSTFTGAGVYKYYFNGNGVRGALVGAQIGASLSYAYSLGQWPNVGKVAAKGFEAGGYKLLSLTISHWIGGTLGTWSNLQKQQDFVEGFAGGVWRTTYGQYLDEFTDIGVGDEIARVFGSLMATVSSAIAFGLPKLNSGEITKAELARDVGFNTIPVWFSGTAVNSLLDPFAPTPTTRRLLKTALMSSYMAGLNALIDLFDDK